MNCHSSDQVPSWRSRNILLHGRQSQIVCWRPSFILAQKTPRVHLACNPSFDDVTSEAKTDDFSMHAFASLQFPTDSQGLQRGDCYPATEATRPSEEQTPYFQPPRLSRTVDEHASTHALRTLRRLCVASFWQMARQEPKARTLISSVLRFNCVKERHPSLRSRSRRPVSWSSNKVTMHPIMFPKRSAHIRDQALAIF